MGVMNLTLVNHLNHFVPVFLRYCEGNIEVSTSRLFVALSCLLVIGPVYKGKVLVAHSKFLSVLRLTGSSRLSVDPMSVGEHQNCPHTTLLSYSESKGSAVLNQSNCSLSIDNAIKLVVLFVGVRTVRPIKTPNQLFQKQPVG